MMSTNSALPGSWIKLPEKKEFVRTPHLSEKPLMEHEGLKALKKKLQRKEKGK
jgi:hypothetical protein